MLLQLQLLIRQHLALGKLPILQHQHSVKLSSQFRMALQQATIDYGLHDHTLYLVYLVLVLGLGDMCAASDDRSLVRVPHQKLALKFSC